MSRVAMEDRIEANTKLIMNEFIHKMVKGVLQSQAGGGMDDEIFVKLMGDCVEYLTNEGLLSPFINATEEITLGIGTAASLTHKMATATNPGESKDWREEREQVGRDPETLDRVEALGTAYLEHGALASAMLLTQMALAANIRAKFAQNSMERAIRFNCNPAVRHTLKEGLVQVEKLKKMKYEETENAMVELLDAMTKKLCADGIHVGIKVRNA